MVTRGLTGNKANLLNAKKSESRFEIETDPEGRAGISLGDVVR